MPPRLKPSIAQLVSSELVRQGVSQRALARVIGCDHTDLNRWLNGQAGFRVQFAERAMAYLGIKAVAPEPLVETSATRKSPDVPKPPKPPNAKARRRKPPS